MADFNELLQELNPAQLQAVQHPPQVPLQILAGPGSGKTKVLTMRVAHLITNCYLPPSTICAVTFTNKAANEMRERLVKLLGKDATAQIRMGTFHALCAMFLRRYAKYVGLEGNFTVCDADESKKIIAKLLKEHEAILAEYNMTLKEGTLQSMISKLKAKGLTADDALAKVAEFAALSQEEQARRLLNRKADILEGKLGRIVATVYKEYEKTLRESNSLDFDDLLLFGVKLFAKHKKASSWCKHVLVDEFQDTNTTQYELMRFIAQSCQCVTIVGDPDQSIYGWRSAEVENLARMQRDFPTTFQIYLEENYRSTAAILAVSLAIISQDKARIQKTLNTSHPKGPLPVLRAFPMESVEAGFIAAEIKRVAAYSGEMLNWNDFVVLLRYNSLSRAIESALQKEGIPSRVLKGHKFFERMEIKDVLAYLQLVDNPAFVPAFTRVVNVPSRMVGEKTVAELLHRAEQLKISPLHVVERIVEGRIPDIKPPVKKKLANFAGVIRDLRKFANEGMAPSKLIQSLLELIKYGEHLRRTQPEYESRWDNVQELINFATEVETDMPSAVVKQMQDAQDAAFEELWGDGLDEWDADQVEENGPQGGQQNGDTPLRVFLQASMLSTDADTADDDNKPKVTISTCHAAKGLEWAVVFVPAGTCALSIPSIDTHGNPVVRGVFPSTRTEEEEEERRLLYVACTRAQGMLYLSHTTTRMMSGESVPQEISPYLAALRNNPQTTNLLSEELSALPREDRITLSKVLNRTPPDDAEVALRVAEYDQTARHPVWGPNAPFRDSPLNGNVNGYAVPNVRYRPEQQGNQAQGVRPAQQQQWAQQGRPRPAAQQSRAPVERQHQWPQHGGRTLKEERSVEDIDEPPVFVASSLVHFNQVHRAGVVQNAQPTSMAGPSSRRTAGKPPSVGRATNAAAPLGSSSSRVVNAPTTPIAPSGSNLRDWIVKPGTHKPASADGGSAKSKGKAKAKEPEQSAPSVEIKVETGSSVVKTESPSAACSGNTTTSAQTRTDPASGPSWIKREDHSPSVKMEPQTQRAPLSTPVKTGPSMRASVASYVKLEPSQRPTSVKLEGSSTAVSSPLSRAPNKQVQATRPSYFHQPKLEPDSDIMQLDPPPPTFRPSTVVSAEHAISRSFVPSFSHEPPASSTPSSSLPSSSSSESHAPSGASQATTPAKPTAVKRRLGMGRATTGYSNKKFKPMMPNGP
ncbi:P-loop containing nucleoside triphosphate hydrolase protein [Daedaleopsis nitida]|nr:P-loop containing nucleoside triphosphate hydrolase protein [Daedaleopsis nitida]